MKIPLAVFLACFAVIELGAAPASRTILVLPFENQSGRADIAWLSESFAETLSTRLAGDGRMVLNRMERDETFREAGILPGTPVTRASALKVARSLDADWVVQGAFAVEGEVLTSQVYLIDAGRLKMSGPYEVNGQLADLADIETRLAWRILAMQDQDFTVGTEEDFRLKFPPLRLDAHENYIRGVLASDPAARVRFLTEADRRDPTDLRAALELGRFYYEQKDYENSAKWLGKLAPLTGDSFEARFMMGVSDFFLARDAAAEKVFVELSREAPLAEVWNNLGFLQARRGQWTDAIGSFDRAYQADSSDPDFSFNLGVGMWNVKKYEAAVRYLREALQFAPDDPEIHRLLSEALAATGDSGGKKKEDQWLKERDKNSVNGRAGAILPTPRLKKHFNRRAHRRHLLSGHTPREASVTPVPAKAEARP